MGFLFHTLLYNIPVLHTPLYTPPFPLCTFDIPMPLSPVTHPQHPLCTSPYPTTPLHTLNIPQHFFAYYCTPMPHCTPLCASALHATQQPSSLIHAPLHPHTPLHKFIFKYIPSTIKAITKYNYISGIHLMKPRPKYYLQFAFSWETIC